GEALLAAPQAAPAPAMALHLEPNPVLIRALSRQLGLLDVPEGGGDDALGGETADDDALAEADADAPTEIFWTVLEGASPELRAPLGARPPDLRPQPRAPPRRADRRRHPPQGLQRRPRATDAIDRRAQSRPPAERHA